MIIKVKEPVKEGYPKKINAKILDFNEGLGVKILTSDTNEEFTIKLDNIFSTRLNDLDFKEDKGE